MNHGELASSTPKMTKNLTPPNQTDVGGMVAENRDDDDDLRHKGSSNQQELLQVQDITRDEDWKENDFLALLKTESALSTLDNLPILKSPANYLSERHNIKVGDKDSILRGALRDALRPAKDIESRSGALAKVKDLSYGITTGMVNQTKQEQETVSSLVDALEASARSKLDLAKARVVKAEKTFTYINAMNKKVKSASQAKDMESLNGRLEDKKDAIKKLVNADSVDSLSPEEQLLLEEIDIYNNILPSSAPDKLDVALAEQAVAKQAARNAEKAAAKEAAAKEAARLAPRDKQAALFLAQARKGAKIQAKIAARAAAKQSPARSAPQDNNQVDAGIRDLSIGDEVVEVDSPITVDNGSGDSPLIIDKHNIAEVLWQVIQSKEFLGLFVKASNEENVTAAHYLELLQKQYSGVHEYIHNNQDGAELYLPTMERFVTRQVNGGERVLSNYQKDGSVPDYDYDRLHKAKSAVKDDNTALTSIGESFLSSLDSVPSMNTIERITSALLKWKKN